MRACLAMLLVFVGAVAIRAQERLEVRGPEPAVLRLGDVAQVQVQIVDPTGSLRELVPPQVDGLTIHVQGPLQQVSTEIVGRSRTQRSTASWQLELQPQRAGTFVVPPFRVWTGTREQTTPELRLEAKQDLQARELGWLDVRVEPQRVYVHEPIRVHLEFGVQQGLRLVQEIADRYRYFDIEVSAPWLHQFPGGEPIEQRPPSGTPQFAVCNRKLLQTAFEPEHERAGKRWQRFRAEFAFLPTQPGRIELAAPSLRFHLIRRAGSNDPFLLGARAQTANYVVQGEPAVLEVLPIPEAGRPSPYYGAVGRFTIEASLDRDVVKVGNSVKLTLTVRGQGNLEFLRLPPLDALAGFHKLGQTEPQRDAERVAVTYDLTPLPRPAGATGDDVREVPAIEWNWFDTTPGVERFVTASTKPLRVTVQPLPPGEALAPLPNSDRAAVTPGVDDVFDLPSFEGEAVVLQPLAPILAWSAVGAPWLLVAAVAWLLRRAARQRADVVGSRARAAGRAAERSLAAGEDPLAVLADYVGARLGEPGAAVITTELAGKLTAAGLDATDAREVASTVEQGTAARYGGGARLGAEVVRALVQRLEQRRFGVLVLWLSFLLGAGVAAGGARAQGEDPAVAAYRAGDYRAADAAFAARYAATGDRRCLQARGNCQVRLGDLPRALWAYECARLGLPRDPELAANLRLVRRRLELDDGPTGLFAELGALRDACTAREQAALCALAMAVAAACFVFGRRRVVLRWIGGVALVPGLALAAEALWWRSGREPIAIALQPLSLTAEPKSDLPPIATVRAGVAVAVLGGSGGSYVRVRAADRIGFAPREQLLRIE